MTPLCIEFKILLLKFKALHNLAPLDLLYIFTPSHGLRSSLSHSLVSPRIRLTTWELGLTHTTPLLWNSLPFDIRNSDSPRTFKSLLKTYLFTQVFYELLLLACTVFCCICDACVLLCWWMLCWEWFCLLVFILFTVLFALTVTLGVMKGGVK